VAILLTDCYHTKISHHNIGGAISVHFQKFVQLEWWCWGKSRELHCAHITEVAGIFILLILSLNYRSFLNIMLG